MRRIHKNIFIFILPILIALITAISIAFSCQFAYADSLNFSGIFGTLNSDEHSGNDTPDNPNSVQYSEYSVNTGVASNAIPNSALADGYYRIRLASSANCYVEIADGGYNRGSKIQINAADNSDGQLWQVKNNTDGSILLINVNSGLVMDIANGAMACGTTIQSYFTNHSTAQNWTPVLLSDGSYALKAAANNTFVLDLTDGKAESGTALQLWSFTESFNQKWAFEAATAPQLEIPSLNLSLNGYTLDQINSGSKETKYAGNNLTIKEQNGSTIKQTDCSNVQIKGRGNSTWTAPKKGYNIKLDSKTNLFGLGKAKNWVLLANYYDPSLERNELSFDAAKNLGLESAFGGQQINLYIDNEYLGMYFLTHKVEINDNVCPCEDDGIVVECDGWTPDDIYFKSKVYGRQMILKDVKDDSQAQTLLDNFKEKWNAFEVAITTNDWETASSLVDLESFTKYVMLCEFNQNCDSYGLSTFFYMKNTTSKIYAGPVWDYDLAWGNNDITGWATKPFGDNSTTSLFGIGNNYAVGLMNFEQFRTLLEQCYAEKLNNQGSAYSTLLNKHYQTAINSSNKNNSRWGLKNCGVAVNELNTYMTNRCAFLDKYYTAHDTSVADGKYTLKSDTNYIISPIQIKKQSDGTYTFQHASAGYLSVANDPWTRGQNIMFQSKDQGDKSKWYIKKQNGKYMLQSKYNGFGLTASYVLQQCVLENCSNQMFNFINE